MPHDVGPGRVVDSHVHLWDPHARRHAWLDGDQHLDRAFGPEDYAAAHGGAADAMVLVQADCSWAQAYEEAAWFSALADAGAPVVGIVAGARLESPDAAEQVGRLGRLPLVRGVRRLLQDEAAGFSLREPFVAGTRLLAGAGLVMDLCVRHHQLDEVTELVARCPEVRFVLDHGGKPPIAAAEFASWAAAIDRLALAPHVSCKLSGLVSEASPATVADVPRYLRHLLEAFGPDRVMFGSDWPVCSVVTTWQDWFGLVLGVLADASDAERDAVLAGNAERVYGLTAPAQVSAR